MSRTAAAVLAFLAAAATVAPAAPQSASLAPGDKLCGVCKTTGRVPFEVPKAVLEMEKGCLECSEVSDNKAINYGLDFMPCPKCLCPSLRDKVKAEWDQKVAARRDWLKERRGIDEYLNDPKDLHLMHVKTEHFDLCWSIPKIKVGNVFLDQHHALHLYAQRLEEAYKAYLDQYGFKHEVEQNGVRHLVMVFDQLRHANKAEPKYTGQGGQGTTNGVKLVGPKSVFCTHWNKTVNPDDEAFHEYLVHNVVHLFLASNYPNMLWLAKKNGWLDEGLSHYFTDKRFGKARTHCYQEQDEAKQWVLTPWRPEVRKLVAIDKIPAFAEVVVKHGEELTAEEHMFVWSWVQYLNDAYDHAKFVVLISGLKEQKPLRDALQEAYGVSMFQFLDKWKKYVLETYPPR